MNGIEVDSLCKDYELYLVDYGKRNFLRGLLVREKNPEIIQAIGLFMIPVLLPCSLPALLVIYEIPWLMKVWCCILAVILVKGFNILYRRGLLKYSSAGG